MANTYDLKPGVRFTMFWDGPGYKVKAVLEYSDVGTQQFRVILYVKDSIYAKKIFRQHGKSWSYGLKNKRILAPVIQIDQEKPGVPDIVSVTSASLRQMFKGRIVPLHNVMWIVQKNMDIGRIQTEHLRFNRLEVRYSEEWPEYRQHIDKE